MNSPTVWLGQLDDNGTPMMKLTRRQSLQMATAAIALPAIVNSAWALDYPTRPVRLIIGYPPGGSADLTARLASAWLSERLGQQFVVESRAGAATNIATEASSTLHPTGYTLLLAAPANATNVALFAKLNFDFIRDTAPVGALIRFPDVVVVNPAAPIHSIPELIAYAKANPGQLNFASSRHRLNAPRRRRTVQDDDQRQYRPRAVSGRRTGFGRSDERARAIDV
jgi:tripartite-type tricarboxylate transporter receptor subunit TctC